MTLRLVPPPPERDTYVRDGLVYERRTPVQCARFDLPYEEWLALPVGVIVEDDGAVFGSRTNCPHCGAGEWGAVNPTGYALVYACHHCRGRFRGVDGHHHDDKQVAIEIVFAAFAGIGKTFCTGKATA